MAEQVTQEKIIEQLRTVQDPELNRDLVSLNMIENVSVSNGTVKFTIVLTTPACPLKSKIQADAKSAVMEIPGVDNVEIKISSKVSHNNQIKEQLTSKIKNIIAVSSGKGGVGKSTIAANLSISLAQTGASVGLMDADIYGPNIPTMMGISELPKPSGGKIMPAKAYSVKVISIGFLVKDGQPLIWRGPLLHGTIRQFLTDVDWGELDYLVVDLPPGTGDVQLSLSQNIPVTCGVVVTMPQKVSLDDASRGIEMYQKLDIPIAGVIENMGAMEMPDGSKLDIFGEGGGEKLAEHYNLKFLGRIPIDPKLRMSGDAGKPIVISEPDSRTSSIINEIACEVASYICRLNLG